MITSSLNIQIAGLYHPIECSIIINVLHMIVVCPDDGIHKQTETGVSKAVLCQFVPKEQFLPDCHHNGNRSINTMNILQNTDRFLNRTFLIGNSRLTYLRSAQSSKYLRTVSGWDTKNVLGSGAFRIVWYYLFIYYIPRFIWCITWLPSPTSVTTCLIFEH
jgi:hypothetical protein